MLPASQYSPLKLHIRKDQRFNEPIKSEDEFGWKFVPLFPSHCRVLSKQEKHVDCLVGGVFVPKLSIKCVLIINVRLASPRGGVRGHIT